MGFRKPPSSHHELAGRDLGSSKVDQWLPQVQARHLRDPVPIVDIDFRGGCLIMTISTSYVELFFTGALVHADQCRHVSTYTKFISRVLCSTTLCLEPIGTKGALDFKPLVGPEGVLKAPIS